VAIGSNPADQHLPAGPCRRRPERSPHLGALAAGDDIYQVLVFGFYFGHGRNRPRDFGAGQ